MNSQVIMKTGVSVWDQTILWDKTVMIIVKSSPDFKMKALHICTEMMQYSIVEDEVSNCKIGIFWICVMMYILKHLIPCFFRNLQP